MTFDTLIDKQFTYAVAGASADPSKYGHQVFKTLRDNGFFVYPLNPKTEEILGEKAFKDLDELPRRIDVLVTVTPPAVTSEIVRSAVSRGVDKVWMQPGSFDQDIVEYCNSKGVEVIAGACIMSL